MNGVLRGGQGAEAPWGLRGSLSESGQVRESWASSHAVGSLPGFRAIAGFDCTRLGPLHAAPGTCPQVSQCRMDRDRASSPGLSRGAMLPPPGSALPAPLLLPPQLPKVALLSHTESLQPGECTVLCPGLLPPAPPHPPKPGSPQFGAPLPQGEGRGEGNPVPLKHAHMRSAPHWRQGLGSRSGRGFGPPSPAVHGRRERCWGGPPLKPDANGPGRLSLLQPVQQRRPSRTGVFIPVLPAGGGAAGQAIWHLWTPVPSSGKRA